MGSGTRPVQTKLLNYITRRDGGFREGGIREGEIGDGEFVEGGC